MNSEETNLRAAVVKGFLWVGTGNFIGQLISWISTIVVIRLLSPSDYGLMAMSGSFVSLLTLISELGIGASIVQAKQITEREIRHIFGLVIASSGLFMIIGYLGAPFIASFYNEEKIVPLIRMMNVTFFLMALYVIPQSIFIRQMNFKIKSQIDIAALACGSVLTVVLALNGAGVWTLVVGPVFGQLFRAVSFNIVGGSWWRPIFNYRGTKPFLSYGLTMTGDRLVNFLYTQADTIVIGKFLGNSLLGVYSVALNLASLPMEKVLPIITQVSFASYSRIQTDVERIRKNIFRTIQAISFIGFPLFFGMAVIAPEAIVLILGPKWNEIVVPFQLLCLVMPFKALSPVLPPAVFAIGKPRVNLVNMILTAVMMGAAFLIGVHAGILGVCVAWLIAYPVVFLLTSWRNLKALGLSLKELLWEISFPLLASLLMLVSLALLKITVIAPQSWNALVLLPLFGIVIYSVLVLIFKKEEYSRLKVFLIGPRELKSSTG
jgi:O-antigen/teichoic acid export membrane protein